MGEASLKSQSSQSSEHEFLPEPSRDECCPPNSSQAHPQTELVSAIASDASHGVGTGSIDEAIERKSVNSYPRYENWAANLWMSVVEQQRGGPGTRHELGNNDLVILIGRVS